jgi:hypothetical protein
MKVIAKKDLALKTGKIIPTGTMFNVTFNERNMTAVIVGELPAGLDKREYKFGYRMANTIFGKPFTKIPSMKALEKYSNDAVCPTVIGNRVEPDGRGSENDPSWLIVFGLI